MKVSIFLMIFIFLGLLITGCEDNSTDSDSELTVDPVLEEQVAIGWEINEAVMAGTEIQELTQSSELIEDAEIEGYSGSAELKSQMNRMVSEMQQHFDNRSLQKTTEDSLIFYDETTREGWGFDVTKALYFDSETGRLRYVEVRFDYPEKSNLKYDSSEVIMYVGDNWLRPTHNQIAELYRLQIFKESFMLQSIESNVTATEYDGNKITGVEMTVESHYNTDRQLIHISKYVKLNADGSGTLRSEHEFKDGTIILNEVTFKNDGTGTFTKERRDGTIITGTFDSVEDDLQGYWSEVVDFPEGRYVDRLERLAVVSIILPDSIFNAAFREIVFFASGRIDSSSIAIQVREEHGVKTTMLSRTKPNGAHGNFVIVENEGTSSLTGYWITWDGYYIDVTAEYFIDGTGHLHYEVYVSEEAFLNEEDPLIIANYYFSPDQNGSGTLVHDGIQYDISFDESGSAKISSDNKSRQINLY